MLKEVNDSKKLTKVNIGRELLKKQIFDCAIIFIAIAALYGFVVYMDFDKYYFFMACIVTLIVVFGLLYFSGNAVKKPLNAIINEASDKTKDDLITIQDKNNSQKENNTISTTKINGIKNLIENLQKYSSDMGELTDKTKEKTDKSLDFTNNEYGAVKTNIEKMFSIRHKIQTIAELILELSDFVQSISSTIGLVEDIAEQTNLLALNAAVEAARAGEHGKGFAVVASEIRKLADESKQATSKIIALINDIQQTANSTVLATEEGTKEIESGLELAHIISENIEQLINVMNEISSNMQEIIVSSKQINADSVTTDEYIREISEIVEKSTVITKENEEIFEKLETTSNNLKQAII